MDFPLNISCLLIKLASACILVKRPLVALSPINMLNRCINPISCLFGGFIDNEFDRMLFREKRRMMCNG